MTVEEALRVLAEAWGPGYELRPPAAARCSSGTSPAPR
jgi:hypothetical protein